MKNLMKNPSKPRTHIPLNRESPGATQVKNKILPESCIKRDQTKQMQNLLNQNKKN